MLRCNHLEEKYQSLQLHIYESSPGCPQKYGNLRNGMFCLLKSLLSPEKDWTELLRLQENVYGLVSKLKGISPKLTEEDLRVCFSTEGVQPAYFADLMKLTTETLTRRISRIKTEKLMLINSKESLEDIIKSLGTSPL